MCAPDKKTIEVLTDALPYDGAKVQHIDVAAK
jgi:hypothetical protein